MSPAVAVIVPVKLKLPSFVNSKLGIKPPDPE
jgi:hypothetical protein